MIDWDAYRAAYPSMTYADVSAFHERVWAAFPDQQYHSTGLVREFFDGLLTGWPVRVVEVGGWRGEAAAVTLRDHPSIRSWTNYEVCAEAVDRPVTSDPRYRAVHPDRWPWEIEPQSAEIAVLAHVIEHMNALQLARLIEWLYQSRVKHIYVESPLRDAPRSWRHSTSAHLLEIGWTRVIELFAEYGYTVRRRVDEPPDRTVLYLGSAA